MINSDSSNTVRNFAGIIYHSIQGRVLGWRQILHNRLQLKNIAGARGWFPGTNFCGCEYAHRWYKMRISREHHAWVCGKCPKIISYHVRQKSYRKLVQNWGVFPVLFWERAWVIPRLHEDRWLQKSPRHLHQYIAILCLVYGSQSRWAFRRISLLQQKRNISSQNNRPCASRCFQAFIMSVFATFIWKIPLTCIARSRR